MGIKLSTCAAAILIAWAATPAVSQTLINQGGYDSKSLVDTNSTSNSVSTVNSTSNTNSVNASTSASTVNSTSANTNTNVSTSVNTNNNINSGTQTINNNNVNSGTLTYNNNNVNTGTMTNNNNNVNTNSSSSTSVNTNNNVNTGTMTYNNNNASTSVNNNVNTSTSTSTNTNNNVNTGDMTNRNINTSTTTSNNVNQNNSNNNNVNQNIQSGDVTNRNINSTEITQRIIQPPPTAVAPSMMSGGNNDLCTTGTSGSVQTQIFGVSGGGTVRDLNCERLKLSKTLYDMGMKVAAVATMCQDRRVFDAMIEAGTPCPYEGKIGEQARAAWEADPEKVPKLEEVKTDDTYKKIGIGALLGMFIFKFF
jgi:hypothetical protein